MPWLFSARIAYNTTGKEMPLRNGIFISCLLTNIPITSNRSTSRSIELPRRFFFFFRKPVLCQLLLQKDCLNPGQVNHRSFLEHDSRIRLYVFDGSF